MDAYAPNAQLARNGCHAKPLRIESAHLIGLTPGRGRTALVFAFSHQSEPPPTLTSLRVRSGCDLAPSKKVWGHRSFVTPN